MAKQNAALALELWDRREKLKIEVNDWENKVKATEQRYEPKIAKLTNQLTRAIADGDDFLKTPLENEISKHQTNLKEAVESIVTNINEAKKTITELTKQIVTNFGQDTTNRNEIAQVKEVQDLEAKNQVVVIQAKAQFRTYAEAKGKLAAAQTEHARLLKLDELRNEAGRRVVTKEDSELINVTDLIRALKSQGPAKPKTVEEQAAVVAEIQMQISGLEQMLNQSYGKIPTDEAEIETLINSNQAVIEHAREEFRILTEARESLVIEEKEYDRLVRIEDVRAEIPKKIQSLDDSGLINAVALYEQLKKQNTRNTRTVDAQMVAVGELQRIIANAEKSLEQMFGAVPQTETEFQMLIGNLNGKKTKEPNTAKVRLTDVDFDAAANAFQEEFNASVNPVTRGFSVYDYNPLIFSAFSTKPSDRSADTPEKSDGPKAKPNDPHETVENGQNAAAQPEDHPHTDKPRQHRPEFRRDARTRRRRTSWSANAAPQEPAPAAQTVADAKAQKTAQDTDPQTGQKVETNTSDEATGPIPLVTPRNVPDATPPQPTNTSEMKPDTIIGPNDETVSFSVYSPPLIPRSVKIAGGVLLVAGISFGGFEAYHHLHHKPQVVAVVRAPPVTAPPPTVPPHQPDPQPPTQPTITNLFQVLTPPQARELEKSPAKVNATAEADCNEGNIAFIRSLTPEMLRDLSVNSYRRGLHLPVAAQPLTPEQVARLLMAQASNLIRHLTPYEWRHIPHTGTLPPLPEGPQAPSVQNSEIQRSAQATADPSLSAHTLTPASVNTAQPTIEHVVTGTPRTAPDTVAHSPVRPLPPGCTAATMSTDPRCAHGVQNHDQHMPDHSAEETSLATLQARRDDVSRIIQRFYASDALHTESAFFGDTDLRGKSEQDAISTFGIDHVFNGIYRLSLHTHASSTNWTCLNAVYDEGLANIRHNYQLPDSVSQNSPPTEFVAARAAINHLVRFANSYHGDQTRCNNPDSVARDGSELQSPNLAVDASGVQQPTPQVRRGMLVQNDHPTNRRLGRTR